METQKSAMGNYLRPTLGFRLYQHTSARQAGPG